MAVRPTLNLVGLCAGVGGLELGIRLGEHLRGYDVRGVCYVEREAAAAASLVASMDAGWLHPAPVWSDLATFDGRPWRGRVHILASGDPCQGNSVAGKGLGSDDPRFLIPQVLRIMDEVRPDRLIRENVTGNAAGQLDALARPLESMGYIVAAGIFSSGRTGNSHGRERLVVMADRAGGAGWLHAGSWRPDEGTAHAGRCSVELVNANSSRWAEAGAEPSLDARREPIARCLDVAHADRERHGREGVARHASIDAVQPGPRLPPAIIPGPSDPRWRDILDRWPQLAPALDEAEAQSLLRGGIDAVASRIERLRACGNGVDPVVGATATLCLGALLADERRARARHAAVSAQ